MLNEASLRLKLGSFAVAQGDMLLGCLHYAERVAKDGRKTIVKKQSIIILFIQLAVFASACQPTPEAAAVTETPQATVTLPPATPTITFTPTEVPIESLSAEQLAEKFLAGDIEDISSLEAEQCIAFSKALAAQKNKPRDTRRATYKNEAYLDPETLTMRQLADGRTIQEQTIEMFLAACNDDEGVLTVILPNGEAVKINGSQGVDWNMLVTDPHDPRIDWPAPSKNQELSKPQWWLARSETEGDTTVLKPIFMLEPKIASIFLENFYGKPIESLQFFYVETDQAGNPISARISILIERGSTEMFEEGNDSYTNSGAGFRDFGAFWEYLNANSNQVYYLIVPQDQPDAMKAKWDIKTDNWSGIVAGDQAFDTFTGRAQNDQDLLILIGYSLIRRK